MFLISICFLILAAGLEPSELPELRVTRDNVVIVESCRVVIPEGCIIEDTDDNGVLHIQAAGITVEFAPGSELRGARPGVLPDAYRGYGIRIADQTGVTIRGARIRGYWCGLHATRADQLVLERIDASDQRRARLKSTPAAEDVSDWLWPHRNDEQEWRKQYGAALCVEQSRGVLIRECRVRESQNGLILDRVSASEIRGNDFSFLSGWGIAMWRSSGNKLLNNAVDFCVRGYSHGVYNRGQDSAGFLVFEQCSDNTFQHNSATHCGDGFFLFAGREALGEAPPPSADFEYRSRGCNDNVLVGNDFSYAAAHGVEITFSFGNSVLRNRLAGNAICGIWGGYSQETVIRDNLIADNGEGAYGLERGGVNIEHGRRNRIVGNRFERNRCGVHLWWDTDEQIAQTPWAMANGVASTENVIEDNEFHGDELALHFRGPSDAVLRRNLFVDVGTEMKSEEGVTISRGEDAPDSARTVAAPPNKFEYPVGARAALAGRDKIIMTEWGPWGHASPLLRRVGADAQAHRYEMRKFPADANAVLDGPGLTMVSRRVEPEAAGESIRVLSVIAAGDGVFPYTLTVGEGDARRELRDTLVVATWEIEFIESPNDPRTDDSFLSQPRDEMRHMRVMRPELRLRFGNGGPHAVMSELKEDWKRTDNFAVRARTRIPLTQGRWIVSTLSDDGVRVSVDGRRLIDNWTWHVPTRDHAEFVLERDGMVELLVEYFELNGYAVLEFEIQRG